MMVRQCPRYPASFPGTLVYQNQPATTKSLDLSRKGCRLRNTAPVIAGMHVDLVLYVPGEDIPLLIRKAMVRWSGAQGIGLEFQPLASPHQARLDIVLRQLERMSNN
jgi:hypothetical protein